MATKALAGYKEHMKKLKNNHYLREHQDAVDELPRKVAQCMYMVRQVDLRYEAISTLIDFDIGTMARMRRAWMRQHGIKSLHGDCFLSVEESESEPEPDKPAARAGSKRRRAGSCKKVVVKERGEEVDEEEEGKKVAHKAKKTLTRKEHQELQKQPKRKEEEREEEDEEEDESDDKGVDFDPNGWRTEKVKALEARIDKNRDLLRRMAEIKSLLAEHTYDRLDISIRRMDTDLQRMEADFIRQGSLPARETQKSCIGSPGRQRGGRGETNDADQEDAGAALLERDDLPVDPNEPVYCICMQVSYGQMVQCDNDECEQGEWFHFPCVNLHRRPRGRWLCPGCTAEQRENRGKARSAAKKS